MKEALIKSLKETINNFDENDADNMADDEFMVYLLMRYLKDKLHTDTLRRIYKVNKDIACTMAYLIYESKKESTTNK